MHARWALLAPVVILGGIYGGICTPTEASVIAAPIRSDDPEMPEPGTIARLGIASERCHVIDDAWRRTDCCAAHAPASAKRPAWQPSCAGNRGAPIFEL